MVTSKVETKPLPSPKPARVVAPFDAAKAKEHQENWAKYLGTPVKYKNSMGMEFALIPPGSFLMGSPAEEEGRNENEVQHRVTLTKGFYLGVHKVTRGQFAQFVKATGYRTQAESEGGAHVWTASEWKMDPKANWMTPGIVQTDDHPVVCLSWNDVVAYADWLSGQDREGRRYRLPTEAEWEYACRAGTQTAYCSGNSLEAFKQVGWGSYNGKWGSAGGTKPVGQYQANGWGLYDMHGNASEWCQDWLGEYPRGDQVDPEGPARGGERVHRGTGGWWGFPQGCRSASRGRHAQWDRVFALGCRLVLVPSGLAETAKAPAPDKPTPPAVAPFRVEMNGLNKLKELDPISFGPDWRGFNKLESPDAWKEKDAFARLRTRATMGYPCVPTTSYVLETELECLSKNGGFRICLGDPDIALCLNFFWLKERDKIECSLCNYHGFWAWIGHQYFNINERLRFKLVVADGHAALLQGDRVILGQDYWPTDLSLRIVSESPDSAVIHQCSFHDLTKEDLRSLLGWPMPLQDLPLNPEETAKRLKARDAGLPIHPKEGTRFLVGTTETPMVWVSPGEFMMGPNDPKDPRGQERHKVKLTRGFWMGQYEVTQREWTLLKPNPSRKRGSPYLPVDWVSWEDAMFFCQALTQAEKSAGHLPTGYEFRLPTEAEWEYACRAGTTGPFSVPPKEVWSYETSGRRPHEVGEKAANPWGLYDMQGNAMEWCYDAWYGYPKNSTETAIDPVHFGNPQTDKFVIRGGAWWTANGLGVWWLPGCTSHWRDAKPSSPAGYFLGFRIVLGPVLQKK